MNKKWQGLSWKQKNAILAVILVAASWIIYNNAIRLTIGLVAECDDLKQRIDSAQFVAAEIAELENELRETNAFGKNDSLISHEQLLDVITTYCSAHPVSLRDFPPARHFVREEWAIGIHEVTVSGRYADIVEFIECLRTKKQGQVVSVSFYSKADKKTKETILFATVYVQTIFNSTT